MIAESKAKHTALRYCSILYILVFLRLTVYSKDVINIFPEFKNVNFAGQNAKREHNYFSH
jgi:hypothetical protein